MSKEDAIKKAVNDCIDQNILKEFLEKHKPEVEKMLLTEWDFDIELKVARKEASDERAIAIAQKMIAKNRLADEIVEFTGLDLNDVLKLQGEA